MEEKKGIDFAAMPRTAIKVVTSPAAFFREMPKTGGFVEPLVFMMVLSAVTGLVWAVLTIIGLNFGVGVGIAIASVVIYPIAAAIFGFIGAAIIFVIWKLLGSQEPYETAYRCVAYLAAFMPIATIINVIPYIGMIISIVLWTFFYVTASVEVHKIPSQKAWFVFGILGGILVILSIGAEIGRRAVMKEADKYRMKLEETTKEMEKGSEDARKAMEELKKRLENK